MKNSFLTIVALGILALTLAACGSSGGSTPVPTTKVALTAYLFGNMSSTSATVTSVHASMKVPSGVFVDYSAPTGSISGTFPIRSRSMAISGPLAGSAATTSGTFNTATGTVELSLLNMPASNNTISALKSSSSGNGTEFATFYFKLATTDINTPFVPANETLTYNILQTDLTTQTSGAAARGAVLKFSTSYQ
jgi:hypothetical protein